MINALQGPLLGAALMAKAGLLVSRLALVYAAFILCAFVSQAQIQDSSSSLAPERGVKAAYLYKFAGYVDWPEGTFPRADTPITIAVMGDDQLADTLSQYVSGRTLDGRPFAVRKQKDDELPDGIHMLFIAHGQTERLRARGKLFRPILIVTESEGALAQGSTINFLVSGGRVRFEVSLESAEKRRLKLSSGLLRVAQNVRAGTP